MTLPRKQLVCVDDTPYYHVVSRCVRRTYLCGFDRESGQNYEHRRQWIEDRIRILSSIFAIEICSYTVMSNHMHIVVKLCPDDIENWSNAEIIERWCSLFKGPLLVQKLQAGDKVSVAEHNTINAWRDLIKQRLGSLSWFMKCLNEPIARQANKEDGCTGHFWESRYKSQALLTEEALLTCMTYVDLNPIRAGLCHTPETSDHTSIKERITPIFDVDRVVKDQQQQHLLNHFNLPLKPLAQFVDNATNEEQVAILFGLQDYIELVDITGRIVREEKRGAIPIHLYPILERLDISHKDWLSNAMTFEQTYRTKFAKKRRKLQDTG